MRDVFLPVFRDEMSEAINAGVNVYIDEDFLLCDIKDNRATVTRQIH